MSEQLSTALGEFWHVGSVLFVLIAVISVVTGFVREYIPQEKLQKHLKNQPPAKGAVMGAALGILTPFCSASMVPVAMGMIEMSAPFSTVFPFLITAPLSNFVVVGMLFGTFGFKVAAFYFVWTFVCAIIAGLTIGRSKVKEQVKTIAEITVQKTDTSSGCCSEKPKKNISFCSAKPKESTACCGEPATEIVSCCEEYVSGSTFCCGEPVSKTVKEQPSGCCSVPVVSNGSYAEKVKNALSFGWILFKRIIPYVLLGAAISGLAVAYVPNEIVEKYVGNSSWYAIPLAAAIGVPLYLRIEMAIPLLSVLLTKGMSMGAAMSLLIGGTGASAPELAILSSMLKPKGIIVFVLTVFTIATAGGALFMFL